MHVTQPAMSGSIARLEAEFGTPLFTRTRKEIVLTPAGKRLLVEGTVIVRSCDRVEAEIKGSAAPQRLRLGMVRTFPTSKLVSLLRAFRTELPALHLVVSEGSPEELDAKLKDHKLDLLFTVLGDTPSAGCLEALLLEERYMLFVSNRSSMATRKSVELSALEGQPFIVRTACETFASTTNLLKERGISTRMVCRTNQDDRALELVRAEVGLALMPELFEAHDVVRIEVSDFPVRRKVGLRWLATRSSETIDSFGRFAQSHRWR